MVHWTTEISTFLLLVLRPFKQILKWVYVLLQTLPRDIRILVKIRKVRRWTKQRQEENSTISKIFSKLVKLHPKKVAYYFEDEEWSYEKVEEFSNKIANYFEKEGYKKGDVIALILDNCIAYPTIWLGLSKNGIATALINTNLVKDSLLQSIETAQCKAVIFGTNHVEALKEISEKLQLKQFYQFRSHLNETHEKYMGSIDLTEELMNISGISNGEKDLSVHDKLLYIYTSGTTGLPKAAVLTHLKFFTISRIFKEACDLTEDDVLYTPLPLYHSTAGASAVSQAITTGATVVIRKRFSASNYLRDCAKYNVTVGQYIGELCRYLLAVPGDQHENYRLRAFIGNGLKPQIWKQFVERFGRVIELYGATDGNIYLANIDGKVGAVGFIPRYLRSAIGTTSIKCNQATGEPIRNKNGFCVECDVGEPGIMIAKTDSNISVMKYEGYSDNEATEKRVLRNVFCADDMYLNSGDILEYDMFGYYYFKDRTGDTFRWKGENVSTSEVEAIISNILSLCDVAVYGVKVPQNDGRAGMAAIVDNHRNLNIETLGHSFKQSLPQYAIPLFLRRVREVPLTGTLKLKKTDLREEGFDIEKISDDIYFYYRKFGKYVLLTPDTYKEINKARLRI